MTRQQNIAKSLRTANAQLQNLENQITEIQIQQASVRRRIKRLEAQTRS